MRIILDGRGAAVHAVLALGMFDGVHIGHRVLLQKAKVLSMQRKVPLVACTFISHPMKLIAPEKCPLMLSTFDERAKLLREQGVDILYAMPFDKTTMDMPPENYVGELVRRFHPAAVVCGYNHSFGRAGKGNPAFLDALGAALGFQTVVVPKITLGGREVSSSAIRAALEQGDVAAARGLLGQPYERRATLARVHERRCKLVMSPSGKLDVPTGDYRVLWDVGGRVYAMLLHVEHRGCANCCLHATAEAQGEGIIRFLTGVEG